MNTDQVVAAIRRVPDTRINLVDDGVVYYSRDGQRFVANFDDGKLTQEWYCRMRVVTVSEESLRKLAETMELVRKNLETAK